MNAGERKARMVIAIKMMQEVVEDVKAELREEMMPAKDRAIWELCGMPLMAHDTHLLQFLRKHHLGFVQTECERFRSYDDGSVVQRADSRF